MSAEKTKAPGYDLLEQAMKNYEQALQTGLKLQQDSAQWWMDCLSQTTAPQDWQKRLTAMASETVPILQKRMEDSLRLMEQTSRTSLDLLKQALDTTKPDSMAAAQTKMQEIWEASLQAMRNNAQALTQLNAKVVDSWTQFFQKGAEAAAAKPKPA